MVKIKKKTLLLNKKVFKIVNSFLFPLSFCIGLIIDSYSKFDLKAESAFYNIVLVSYTIFCSYISIFIIKKLIKIKSVIVKLFLYIVFWTIPLLLFTFSESTPEKGILATATFLIFEILVLTAIYWSLFTLYKLRKLLLVVILGMVILSVLTWLVWDKIDRRNLEKEKIKSEVKVDKTFLIQAWQLNSRYKINNIVQFVKVDLDSNGQDEIAAITSYDKIKDEVFYYAGFYRYNKVSEMWDEFYSEELNILNYGLEDKEKIDDVNDFNKKIIDMWSNKFTTIKNIGDVTGDNCPEIVFSSLVQGENLFNNIIVAQAGTSHYRFKILGFMDSNAEILSEDGLIIKKYTNENNTFKDIYKWDEEKLYFKLFESQKEKIIDTNSPKTNPFSEELSG